MPVKHIFYMSVSLHFWPEETKGGALTTAGRKAEQASAGKWQQTNAV